MALFTPMAYWADGTPPAPPFSPTNIPNLAGWYDASDTGSSYKKSVNHNNSSIRISRYLWR